MVSSVQTFTAPGYTGSRVMPYRVGLAMSLILTTVFPHLLHGTREVLSGTRPMTLSGIKWDGMVITLSLCSSVTSASS
jgi:hypothetical protein